MKPIFDAPELIILVFQSCDKISDGVSLASTCKFLASVWRAHAAAILYPPLEAKTAGFNQALLAVRATKLVCDACQANELPPHPFPLHELRVRKPDIGELKQVRNLQHLVRCIEHTYFRGDHPDQHHLPNLPEDLPDEERIRMSSRVRCAMYRVLVAGAVLTPAYLEPLFLAPVQGPPEFLHRLTRLRVDDAEELNGLLQEDIEYLARFPVYDLEASQEKWEPAFGDLARWLLCDIERTFTKVEPSKLSHLGMAAEELGRLQEVTFFLAAYDHMMDKFFNKSRRHPDGDDDSELEMGPPPLAGRVQKTSIAMFGIFRPEEVSMPERVEDSSNCYLINEPLVPKEHQTSVSQDGQVLDSVSPWTVDIRWVLEILHKKSGRPNLRNGRPSPPPHLRSIEFLLAEFFQIKFKDGFFSSFHHLMDYQLGFLSNNDLFRDRSITVTTWLFAEYKVPSLGYRRL